MWNKALFSAPSARKQEMTVEIAADESLDRL